MKKFTVFTVILAITVIVTVSEMFVDDYLPDLGEKEGDELTLTLPQTLDLSQAVKTDALAADNIAQNKLGSDVELETTNLEAGQVGSYDNAIPNLSSGSGYEQLVEKDEVNVAEASDAPIKEDPIEVDDSDFENQSFNTKTISVHLRQEQIESAGFGSAYIESEESDGKLYKTIDVGDLYDTQMEKFVIRTKDELMAKVYVFTVGTESSIEELYQLLKSRCGQVASAQLNETNEYGGGSFYMNDSSRANTVFLTAKIGQTVYGFSYPKTYHQQVKNLIQLITWELG